MLKRLLIAFAFSFFFTGVKAQFDTSFITTSIRHCADSLAIGFKKRDWELYARYTYPAIIGKAGGKKEFINYISQMFSQAPDSAWKKYEMGEILQVIKTEKDFQAVIDLHSIFEWRGIRVTTTSHLIGESWSGGLYWTFFDSENDAKAARMIKPDLSDLLIIPKKMEKMEPITPINSSKQKAKQTSSGVKSKTKNK